MDGQPPEEGGEAQPGDKHQTPPSEWHLQRAEDLAWWTQQAANTSAAGFIQSGIGIAGIALIVLMSSDITGKAALLLPVAAFCLLVSLGAGLVTMRRQRNHWQEHAGANHYNVQLQRKLHNQSPDPAYEDWSVERLKDAYTEARADIKNCPGEKPWIHIQFISLLLAFIAVLAWPVIVAIAAW